MLPPFGYILFDDNSDGSSALRGWSDTTDALEAARIAFKEMGEDTDNMRIAPAENYELTFNGFSYNVSRKQAVMELSAVVRPSNFTARLLGLE